VLSYFQPVSLRRSASEVSGYLELLLYRNQFRLFTTGAFYSDGDRYFPAVALAEHLREFLPSAKSVLVLGAGLGSIVHVMRARGYDPRYTLVEKDEKVLKWALDILSEVNSSKLEPIREDAESFMAQNERKYDLVFVDVFKGRAVPDFVTAPLVLRQCRDSLSPGGRLVLNYIEVDDYRWEKVRTVIAGVFPGCRTVSKDDNRVLISSPSAPACGCAGHGSLLPRP
jgi:spermidine synthase